MDNFNEKLANFIKQQYVLIPFNISQHNIKRFLKIRTETCSYVAIYPHKKPKYKHLTIISGFHNSVEECSRKLDIINYVKDGPFVKYGYRGSLGPFLKIGNYHNGVMKGYGKYIGTCTFEGNYDEDLLNGSGTMTFKNGTYIEGIWKDNICIDGTYYDSKGNIISENIRTTDFCDDYRRKIQTMRIYNTSYTLDLYYFAATGAIFDYDDGPKGPTGPPPG